LGENNVNIEMISQGMSSLPFSNFATQIHRSLD
jgi:hypothetical protein